MEHLVYIIHIMENDCDRPENYAESVLIELTRRLIDSGARIDDRGRSGMTTLMWAARRGHAGLVAYLLRNGANVLIRDRKCRTALIHAMEAGHYHIAELIAGFGKDLKTGEGTKSDSFKFPKNK